MNQQLSKRNKIILTIVVVFVLAIFSILTYAFFSAGGVTNNPTESNVVTLTSNYGNIIVRYLGGNIIQSEDVVLLQDEGDSTDILKFSVQNTGSVAQDVIIHWKDLVNTFCRYQSDGRCTNVTTDEDVRNELNYTLYECNSEAVYNSATESNLTGCTNNLSDLNTTVPNTGSTVTMHTAGKITIAKETTKYYVFQLTIENLDTEQNYNQNKSMSAKIIVDYPLPTLVEAIEKVYTAVSDAISSDYVTSATGINFAEISSNTNGKGLYINNKENIIGDPTKDKIKYFRGDVDNYVEFGTYNADNYHPTTGEGIKEQYATLAACQTAYSSGNCALYHSAGDPIAWRIVRIDETNEVRLITEDTIIPKTPFNTTYTDPKYVGYTTNRSDDASSFAPIKEGIDGWYASNLLTYAGYINQTAEYCNDASGSTDNFGPRARLEIARTPTYNCALPISNYGGTYELPIAMITADEAAYAGGMIYYDNTTYYLNNGTNFWTMSPNFHNAGFAYGFHVPAGGKLSVNYIGNTVIGSRAVITLNNNVMVKGQGTSDDPWIIQ